MRLAPTEFSKKQSATMRGNAVKTSLDSRERGGPVSSSHSSRGEVHVGRGDRRQYNSDGGGPDFEAASWCQTKIVRLKSS